ncbi:unnamed protein product [Rotaria sp. Silwood1]|nr:unnamed protein product [Rotaria sp. Silwood1]CAF3365855.1 unnamed protein product [Rotaria sp. Silwood1]CAF4523178.1 unnamed protein product [Rotaria sp. Silwood1]
MGSICCKSYNVFSQNRSDALPSLVFYIKTDSLPRISSQIITDVPRKINADKLTSTPIKSVKQDSSDRLLQYRKSPIIENYIIIWLTTNIDENQNLIDRFRHSFNYFQLFIDINEFFAFIHHIKDEKIFLILSDIFVQKVVSCLHQMSQLIAIYIISNDRLKDKSWINQYRKIKGIFTNIEPICKKLQDTLYLSENDSISIEILNSSSIIIQYLLKKILLDEIAYDEKSKRDFINFAREQYRNKSNVINEFEEDYIPSRAIWWYTRKCFLYIAINQAFGKQNLKLLIKMGFFIRDLHQQINQSFDEVDGQNNMIVYRGQGILEDEIEILKNNKNSILSFNNFLWTNIDRQISLSIARSAKNNPNLFGVLFRISINSSIKYISLENLSYYLNSENEILFSIYSLFRIGNIKQIEDKIWQINLILINNDKQQLNDYLQPIKHIKGQTSWQQLGFYFIQINQLDKAEELYKALIESNSINNSEHLTILHEQLEFIYNKKNHLIDSLLDFKTSPKKSSNHLSQNNSSLYSKYLNNGILLHKQNNLNEAIRNFKCALNIAIHALEIDHLQIASLYNHIAEIYNEKEIFVEAIVNYQSALENELKHFPRQYVSIAKTYNKIGKVFYRIEDYMTAFSYYEKTLKIQKKFLSPNHSILAVTNYNIAMVFDSLQEYKKAIEYVSQAVNIARHSFGSNHEDVRFYEDYLCELREKTSIGVIPNGSVYE